ncbi:hypothetical protein V1517DRAFT_349997 [Lipomyces orientalis]|uniref:Uncharacterized protein n=1 Tax=Lipomyces orientalis TaxID=1233043 RepID=A0ACC3TZT9_9ASCO
MNIYSTAHNFGIEQGRAMKQSDRYMPLFTLGTSMPAPPEHRLGVQDPGDSRPGTPLATNQSGQDARQAGETVPRYSSSSQQAPAPTNQPAERCREEPREEFVGPVLPTTCNPANLFIVKPLTPQASPVRTTAALPDYVDHRPPFVTSFRVLDAELALITPPDSSDNSQSDGSHDGNQYDWCTHDTETDPAFAAMNYLQAEYHQGSLVVDGQPFFGDYIPQNMIVEPEERDMDTEYVDEQVSTYLTMQFNEDASCSDGLEKEGDKRNNSKKKNDDTVTVGGAPDHAPLGAPRAPELLTVNFVVVANNKTDDKDGNEVKVTAAGVVQEDSDYEDDEKYEDDESDYEEDQPRKRRRTAVPKKASTRVNTRPRQPVPKTKPAAAKQKMEYVPPPLTESEKRKSAHFIDLPDELLTTLSSSVYPSRLNAADFTSDVILMANPTEHIMYAPPQLPNMHTYKRCEPHLRHLSRGYRIRIDDIEAEITTAELDRYFAHVSEKRKKPKNVTLTEDIGKAYFRMAYHSGVPGCVDIVISAAMHLPVKLNEYGVDEAKRPENLFIKFKNGLQDKILRVAGDDKIDRSKISTLAGFMEWKFSDTTKSIFGAIQGEIAELHKMVHPDYKYKPRKRQ